MALLDSGLVVLDDITASGDLSVGGTVSATTGTFSKTAHASGADDYHLELYSGNTGDSNKEVSLRFHQGGIYWGQIRFRASQFYFTGGGDNTMYAVNTGALIATSVYTGGTVSAAEVSAAAFIGGTVRSNGDFNTPTATIVRQLGPYAMDQFTWRRVVPHRFTGMIVWTPIANDHAAAVYTVAENSNAAGGNITRPAQQTDYYSYNQFITSRWNGGWLEFSKAGISASFSNPHMYYVTIYGAII